MKIALTGVLFDVDAALRASGVPLNPRVPLRWPVGSDVTIDLLVLLASTGVGVDLTPVGTVVEFKARQQPTPLDVPVLLDVVATGLLSTGHCTLTISHAVQAPLLAKRMVGRLFYDIWYKTGTGLRDAVIPTSPLILEPPVSDVPTT